MNFNVGDRWVRRNPDGSEMTVLKITGVCHRIEYIWERMFSQVIREPELAWVDMDAAEGWFRFNKLSPEVPHE
jgi:hypothetical protein